MNVLFIHQAFPGQFKHLAPALARIPGISVRGLALADGVSREWQGVTIHPYQVTRGTSRQIHPWVADMETKVIRADACFRAALALKQGGYTPDVIVAHHGWGESLFLKEVWPKAKLGIYCEFFYHTEGADVGFDPEFPVADPAYCCRIRMKNANNLLHFDLADAAISPTHWQASTFPDSFRSKISVIHEGIDTDVLVPVEEGRLVVNGSIVITKSSEVITFVNRNLEPTRGYHIFMRALPRILAERPQARVFIVGGDGLSYGAKNEEGISWKEKFIREVRPGIPDGDWQRVHFTGKLAYPEFVRLLQLSTVHVYLTYPFVLSWSLLEAMSIGCTIVASNTKPLQEVIVDGENGRLVDFFDVEGLATQVVALLANPAERMRLGVRARQDAIAGYDLRRVCLPRQIEWVKSLGGSANG